MRKRFTRDEREAFVPGTLIEWRNGRYWHPGIVVGGLRTRDGWQYVSIENQSSRGGVPRGETFGGYPTSVRLPVTS